VEIREKTAQAVHAMSDGELLIRPAVDADGPALADLYNFYVLNTITTFEAEPVSAQEMADRARAVLEQGLPWYVAEAEGRLVGYSCAVSWKSRSAYRHSCESTIYLVDGCAERGWGSTLYRCLIAELQELGLHAVLAGIAQPNEASIKLHEKLGFSKVAHFSEVGRKFDRWIDVAYWQLLL
jgi:L-amino acid N-acyltransferase YncA